MRYFVITPDGNRYGPVDLPGLQEWCRQGRILPDSPLQNELTGMVQPARDIIAAPFFPAPTMMPPSAPYPPGINQTGYPGMPAEYPRPNVPGSFPGYDDGSNDVRTAWTMFAAGLICCQFLCVLGYFSAAKAERKGHPGAKAAKLANGILLILMVLGIVFYAASLTSASGI